MDPLQAYVTNTGPDNGVSQDIMVEDPTEVLSVEVSDLYGNTEIPYSNPNYPYPQTTTGGSIVDYGIQQLLIYNDPRAALKAVQDMNLKELM